MNDGHLGLRTADAQLLPGLGFASRFRVWGLWVPFGLGWVEDVEFAGVLGGRVERVGKMMGK